jgi:hypothetical protein
MHVDLQVGHQVPLGHTGYYSMIKSDNHIEGSSSERYSWVVDGM